MMLRRTLRHVLLGSLLLSSLQAGEEEDVAEIRKLYNKIESATPADTRKIEFNLENDPMEGTITTHTYPGGLTKIEFSFVAGDHGGADQTFYFGNAGLFFVFEEGHSWRFGQRDAQGNSTTVDSLTESRFYYRGGKCIRKLVRSAESSDAKKLPSMITKVDNRKEQPGEEAIRLFKRALALRGLTTGKEAARYFGNE